MKVLLYLNEKGSVNWGTKATVEGLKNIILKNNGEIFSPEIIGFCKSKRAYKKIIDFMLFVGVMTNSKFILEMALKKSNLSVDILKEITHVVFNGEGAIHKKSGHFYRLIGLANYAKILGLKVCAVNQTVDIKNISLKSIYIRKVYNDLDFVSVRENLSYDVCKKIGISNVSVMPDAAYNTYNAYKTHEAHKKNIGSDGYITISGSSLLKKNKKSIAFQERIIKAIQKVFPGRKIIYLVNAKTDSYLANKLKVKYDISIVDSAEKDFYEVMHILENAKIHIGGRQHINIFSYMVKTPYIYIDGNTFKNKGVAKLQNYKALNLKMNLSCDDIVNIILKAANQKNEIKNELSGYFNLDTELDSFLKSS